MPAAVGCESRQLHAESERERFIKQISFIRVSQNYNGKLTIPVFNEAWDDG